VRILAGLWFLFLAALFFRAAWDGLYLWAVVGSMMAASGCLNIFKWLDSGVPQEDK